MTSVLIKACDTDVLDVADSVFATLQNAGTEMLCVEYGRGQFIKWLSIHDMEANLGIDKSSTMVSFTPSLVVLFCPLLAESPPSQTNYIAGMRGLPSSGSCLQNVRSVTTSRGKCSLQRP